MSLRPGVGIQVRVTGFVALLINRACFDTLLWCRMSHAVCQVHIGYLVSIVFVVYVVIASFLGQREGMLLPCI